MSRPDGNPSAAPQPDRGPVLDTDLGWSTGRLLEKRLYADRHQIVYGKKAIALDQVDWVGYSATQTATKRMLYPTTHDGQWNFTAGRFPYYGGVGRKDVSVHFYVPGRGNETPAEWTFLVNLSRQYLEPRLLADMVAQVKRGETVTIGVSVKVNQSGIACGKPRVSLPWASVGGAEVSNGMVWIYQVGVQQPVLSMPLDYPNAILTVPLFAAITS